MSVDPPERECIVEMVVSCQEPFAIKYGPPCIYLDIFYNQLALVRHHLFING